MLVGLSSVGEAVVWLMRNNGWTVDMRQDGETYHAVATHPTEPQQEASGTDAYSVVCELAELCGMELEDG